MSRRASISQGLSIATSKMRGSIVSSRFSTIPTVVALRRRFEEVRQSEIKRLEPKLNGLTPEARARVEEVTRLLVQKLLLTPTERLKATSDATVATQYAEAITELFQLGEESDANDSGGTEQNPEHDP